MLGPRIGSRPLGFQTGCALLAIMLLCPKAVFAAAPEVTLTGDVVDTDGKPVAGVHVIYVPSTDHVLAGTSKENPFAQTDAEGRFRLVVQRTIDEGRWLLIGRLWGFTPGRQAVVCAVSEKASGPVPVRLVLGPRAKSHLTVLDPEGRPVSGARVAVQSIHCTVQEESSSFITTDELPQTIKERSAATADEYGVAIIGTELKNADRIEVVSSRFGIQRCRYVAKTAQEGIVRMGPVGRVRGLLVTSERATIRGVNVRLATSSDRNDSSVEGAALVTVDEQGLFDVTAIAEGRLRVELADQVHSDYVAQPWEHGEVRAGEAVAVCLTLKPAVRVRGILREKGTGKPIAYVKISGVDFHSRDTLTDGEGRFEFVHDPGFVTPIFDWKAKDGRLQLAGACKMVIPAGQKQIDLPPVEVVPVQGRIIDSRGKPIPDATFGYVACEWDEQKQQRHVENELLSNIQIRSDADGRYRLLLVAGLHYRLTITAEGCLPLVTEWMDLRKRPGGALSEIVLKREGDLAAVSGRVIDRKGNPIAGVAVYQTASGPVRTHAATDIDGRFRLDGIRDERAAVFLEKSGFRFQGQLVSKGAENAEFVLTRVDEPPRRSLATLPPPLPRADRLAIVRRLLEPEVKIALAGNDPYYRSLFVLAKIAPDRVRDLLDQKAIKGLGALSGSCLLRAVSGPKENQERVLASIQAIDVSFERLDAYLQLCDRTPTAERKQKLQFLGHAADDARKEERFPVRIDGLGRIAHRFLSMGEKEQAMQLFREGQLLAKEPSVRESYGLAPFVGRLARMDLSAALKLVPNDNATQSVSCFLEIGQRLADTNPAEAERMLTLARSACRGADSPNIDEQDGVLKICRRMAPLDPARARRIADQIRERTPQVYAYLLIAQATAKSQPRAAESLLRQALAGLGDANIVAESFLPVAEQIDPQLVDEFLWRAVSLRRPQREIGHDLAWGDSPQQVVDAKLAARLARYDRETAEAILLPAWDSVGEEYRDNVLVGLACIDVRKAITALENAGPDSALSRMALRLAEILAAEDEDFWRESREYAIGSYEAYIASPDVDD